jgi:methanogenic corrinoid protein MtbC1
MNSSTSIASLVEQHAQAIANSACSHLLAENTDLSARFGDEAQELWTNHLNQRALELSAALEAGDRRLFTSRIAWSRTALQARHLTSDDLLSSLVSLRTGVEQSLLSDVHDDSLNTALEYIDHAMQALEKSIPESMQPTLDAGFPNDKLALQYIQSVVAGNVIAGMHLVLDAVAHGLPVYDAYLQVLLPAQKEVGRLWHLNELSVSEEHLVSHTTQRVMAVLATRMPRKPDNGFTAIAGAVAGNIHDIGIRAISYLLEFEGWRVIYLGSDMPRKELPATIDTYEADVILLSVALSTQIPATKRAVEEIRSNCKQPVKIMLGGNGLIENSDLWQTLGADGCPINAPDALDMALWLANDDRE